MSEPVMKLNQCQTIFGVRLLFFYIYVYKTIIEQNLNKEFPRSPHAMHQHCFTTDHVKAIIKTKFFIAAHLLCVNNTHTQSGYNKNIIIKNYNV